MDVGSKTTINDVAELSGVSPSTVSLVINNHPRISQATVLKVREAANKIGYKPVELNIRKGHRPKRSRPASYRKMQVALISQAKPFLLKTPVYSKLLHGIEDELGKINYNFIIRNLPEVNPEQAIPHKIDGAILFVSPFAIPQPLLGVLRKIPCVRAMGVVRDDEFFDHVTYNNGNVGKLAAEYLLSKGHRRLAFFGTNMGIRYKSFKEMIEAAGAQLSEFSDAFIDETAKMQLPNVKAIGNAIEKIKQLPEFPSAIFAEVDVIAVGLYLTLKHYDIIPGKDVEIVGANNDYNILNNFSPRPPSVDIHPEGIGRKAVEQLLWRIDNPKEPLGRIEIEPEMAFE